MLRMPKFAADPRLDGLFDLALRDGVDIRPTLLRVLTDLYVQKPFHTQDEETQYVELATGLIEAVDAATRTAVAARLQDYPAAPAAVLARLKGIANVPARAPVAPPADDLTDLFFSASPDERRLIIANLLPQPGARRPRAASEESLARLEAAALQRNPAEFARTLRVALGIAPALAERIVEDATGEPLVIAAKALGMPAATLQRILLFLNPVIGQSVGRVYELAALFDEIAAEGAEQMVAIWRGMPRRAPAHETATYDDERRSARSFASHERRRGGARTEPTPRRAERAS
jgi:uncharacterized protein (DUF2336 family)